MVMLVFVKVRRQICLAVNGSSHCRQGATTDAGYQRVASFVFTFVVVLHLLDTRIGPVLVHL